MEDAQLWIEKGINFIVEFGPKVLGAILIYIIGSWVIKKLVKLVRRGMTAQEYDKSLQRFLLSLVNLVVGPFCRPEDYWDVYFGTIEGSKLALDNAGIEIPYPHAVEIHKES